MVRQDFDPRWLQDHRYGLIDAAWIDDIPAQWPQRTVAPPALGSHSFGMPVLVDLQAIPAEALDGLIRQVHQQVVHRETTVLSWLIGFDGSMDELAAHMAQRMMARIPGRHLPMKFRYFDPGTTVQLHRVIGSAGLGWLLGPIRSVWVPWAGQWMHLERPAPAPLPFAWTQDMTDRALRLGVVNRVAALMDRPAGVQDWIDRTQRIDGHVLRLRQRYAHLSLEDLTELTWHVMVVHPHIDHHPRIAQWLEQLRHVQPEDELDYRELTARLDEAQWRQMAAELSSQAPTSEPALYP
jgi:hypothetical protein